MLFFSALWIYAGIMSPFLCWCFYDALNRFSWIASPKVIFPGAVLGSVLAYAYFGSITTGSFAPAYYDHFLIFGGAFLLCYYVIGFRMGYSKVDGLVLGLLTVVAVDELWQTPINILDWTVSWQGFAIGIATAGWNLMSIPFIFYFMYRINGRVRIDAIAKEAIAVAAVWTAGDFLYWFPGSPVWVWYDPYFLIIPWFFVFIDIFGASRQIFPVKMPPYNELAEEARRG